MADQQDRLTLTVQEAANRLGIGRSLAYAAIEKGDIPSIRIGRVIRVPVRALDEKLNQQISRQSA